MNRHAQIGGQINDSFVQLGFNEADTQVQFNTDLSSKYLRKLLQDAMLMGARSPTRWRYQSQV
jgi:hypothetical protein